MYDINSKNEKGITLISILVYTITITIVLGTFGIVTKYFNERVLSLKKLANNSFEFDKFNSNFIVDVKSNKEYKIQDNGNIVAFGNGVKYIYNKENKAIYRDKVKIVSKVENFQATPKYIKPINGVRKNIITINIEIGKNNMVNKRLDYVLRYW